MSTFLIGMVAGALFWKWRRRVSMRDQEQKLRMIFSEQEKYSVKYTLIGGVVPSTPD